MNDMTGISQATRERVQQLAAELGYTPSRFAKGLVQGARISVGLAIPDLTNPYFPAFASSVVEAATQRGWNIVMDDYGHGTGSALDAAGRLSPHVDGLIGYFGDQAGEAQAAMGRRPVVGLDEPAGPAAGRISFDYRHAARLGLQRLLAIGRTGIAYLDSAQGGPATSRGDAVEAVAEQLGVEVTRIEATPSAPAAREATEDLFRSNNRIDGLLAFNDLMATGALKALQVLGKAVPDDVAVIGMDGIPLGELVTPELTTLSLDLRSVGRTAVDLLDGLLAGRIEAHSDAAALTLRHQLVLRHSA